MSFYTSNKTLQIISNERELEAALLLQCHRNGPVYWGGFHCVWLASFADFSDFQRMTQTNILLFLRRRKKNLTSIPINRWQCDWMDRFSSQPSVQKYFSDVYSQQTHLVTNKSSIDGMNHSTNEQHGNIIRTIHCHCTYLPWNRDHSINCHCYAIELPAWNKIVENNTVHCIGIIRCSFIYGMKFERHNSRRGVLYLNDTNRMYHQTCGCG